jgi:hypothetical protein
MRWNRPGVEQRLLEGPPVGLNHGRRDSHRAPLWEPMCYAQIGGLTIATFVTLLLVLVIYAIFVKDLKIVKWEALSHPAARTRPPEISRTPSGARPVGAEG